MNLQFYFEKLKNSQEYKEFVEKNPEAYFCSGFFILDKTEKNQENKQHLDFYVASSKKIFSFQLEEGIKLIPMEIPIESFEQNIPEKISEDYDIDFDKIEKIILNKMEQKNIKKDIQKILLSLQKKNKKCFFIGTIFISSLGMIKIKINLENNEIIEFNTKSFLDMIKVFKKKDTTKKEHILERENTTEEDTTEKEDAIKEEDIKEPKSE